MGDISGYAIQWGQPAIIGGLFEERFARGAFDKSIREYPDVAMLWAHDASRPLGRVGNGSLTLRPDNVGLWYSLTPNPDSPTGKEAAALVGRADVSQVSVGFFSEVEEWDDTAELPKRLIVQARLWECSLVLWGAYGAATSATMATDNAASARLRIVQRMEAAHKLRGIK